VHYAFISYECNWI